VREKKMAVEDEDVPAAYLFFTVVAIIVIAVTAVGAFLLLIHN
jgi:hypothetical protein